MLSHTDHCPLLRRSEFFESPKMARRPCITDRKILGYWEENVFAPPQAEDMKTQQSQESLPEAHHAIEPTIPDRPQPEANSTEGSEAHSEPHHDRAKEPQGFHAMRG